MSNEIREGDSSAKEISSPFSLFDASLFHWSASKFADQMKGNDGIPKGFPEVSLGGGKPSTTMLLGSPETPSNAELNIPKMSFNG